LKGGKYVANIETMVGSVSELAGQKVGKKPEKPIDLPKVPKVQKEQEWLIKRKMTRIPTDGKQRR
jgi:hypothetical protein